MLLGRKLGCTDSLKVQVIQALLFLQSYRRHTATGESGQHIAKE